MLVGADTGQVHGIQLAGEIVERQADERCRRAAEELVDRTAKGPFVIRCASLRQNSVLGEPRLNHRPEVAGGLLASECGVLLSAFFADRR